MRSRPDRVSGTTSTSVRRIDGTLPRSAPLPVVRNGVFHQDVRRSIESAWESGVVLLVATGAWSDSAAAEIVSAPASLPVDAMQHLFGDVGRPGPATLNSCAHNLPSHGRMVTVDFVPFPLPPGESDRSYGRGAGDAAGLRGERSHSTSPNLVRAVSASGHVRSRSQQPSPRTARLQMVPSSGTPWASRIARDSRRQG
jgi:hypothetical protein